MRTFFVLSLPLSLSLSFSVVGCASDWQARYDLLGAALAPPRVPSEPLEGLAALVYSAVRTHPRVLQARAKAEAAMARAGGAGSLDDPMLFLKTDSTPFGTGGGDPVRSAGLSQTFALGKLGPRSDIALAEAGKEVEEYRRAVNDIAAEVRRAWADYAIALKEREIHNRHAELMKAFIDVAETKYSNGKVSQQDVLEGRSGAAMIHVSLTETSSNLEAARALIVELTGLEPPAPVLHPKALTIPLDRVLEIAAASRPELRRAQREIARAEAAQTLASRERWIPDITAEVEYLQMPSEDDAFAATLGFNLPWFSPARKAAETAAARELDAAKLGLEAERRSVTREVTAAWHKLKSALASYETFTKDLVPRGEQTLEVARTNYEKDRVDFLRFLKAEQDLRTVELEAARAAARVELAWADLERATGADLRR